MGNVGNEWWRLEKQLIRWGLVRGIDLEQSHGIVFLLIVIDSKVLTRLV